MKNRKVIIGIVILVILGIVLLVLGLIKEKSNDSNIREFSGSLDYDTTLPVKDVFNIDLGEFIESSTDNSFKASTNNNCNISFAKVNGYESAEELIKSMTNYYKATYDEQEINNVHWYHFAYTTGDIVNNYITEKDNNIYIYELHIANEEVQDACINSNVPVINSISYKE